MPHERRRREDHHRRGAHDHYHDPDPQIHLLVGHEPGRDPLVDHIRLLEEPLPRRHRGADNRDDQQHHGGHLGAGRHAGHQKVMTHTGQARADQHEHRHQQQRADHQRHAHPLEAANEPVLAAPNTTAADTSTPESFETPR
jgi:hypothetical protein